MTSYDIIRRPIVTERTMDQLAQKKYTFEVLKSVGKIEIKKAIEEIFGVKVDAVNTMNIQGKPKKMGANIGKRPDWKKAIVTLTKDSKTIEFFDGMV